MALMISASILGIPAIKTRTLRTQLVLLGLDARIAITKIGGRERVNVADAGPRANGPLGPANDPEPRPSRCGPIDPPGANDRHAFRSTQRGGQRGGMRTTQIGRLASGLDH